MILNILEKAITSSSFIVTADKYMSVISLANDFGTAASVAYLKKQEEAAHTRYLQATEQPNLRPDSAISRGMTAIGLGLLLAVANAQSWSAYWSPIFSCLMAQCISPCRDIRYNAMVIFQKLLLSIDNGSNEHWWHDVFNKALFPLNLQLLEPDVIRLDLTGILKSHVQVATLTCKAFLRYLNQLQHQEPEDLVDNGDVPDLWFRILDVFEQMAERGQGTLL
ncbi:hypothetical protein BJX68DRAFT_267352 [Aspergillus pseudodeflectus]|uniref:GBF1-like tetratricopeptide repeats domain-containing protein n=1 Tax=Aspergillus pseudodeflectus TaxID=176178 RepID=A0ABR4K9P6_9EURO